MRAAAARCSSAPTALATDLHRLPVAPYDTRQTHLSNQNSLQSGLRCNKFTCLLRLLSHIARYRYRSLSFHTFHPKPRLLESIGLRPCEYVGQRMSTSIHLPFLTFIEAEYKVHLNLAEVRS